MSGLTCPPGCTCWQALSYGPERRREYGRHWQRDHRANMKANRDRYHERKPDASRIAFLKHKHGLTMKGWQALRDAQDGLCYLCKELLGPDSEVHIDHDHSCCPPTRSCDRRRRGLAHRDCNRLIGIAGEDPGKLELMAANLRAAQLGVTS